MYNLLSGSYLPRWITAQEEPSIGDVEELGIRGEVILHPQLQSGDNEFLESVHEKAVSRRARRKEDGQPGSSQFLNLLRIRGSDHTKKGNFSKKKKNWAVTCSEDHAIHPLESEGKSSEREFRAWNQRRGKSLPCPRRHPCAAGGRPP